MNSNNKLNSLVPLQLPVMVLAVQHMGEKRGPQWCGLHLDTEKPVSFSEGAQNGSQRSLSATSSLCSRVALALVKKRRDDLGSFIFPLSYHSSSLCAALSEYHLCALIWDNVAIGLRTLLPGLKNAPGPALLHPQEIFPIIGESQEINLGPHWYKCSTYKSSYFFVSLNLSCLFMSYSINWTRHLGNR